MHKTYEFLQTRRTRLRSFRRDDFSALQTVMRNPEVMKFTGFKKPQTDQEIRTRLEKWIDLTGKSLGVWCAEEKSSGEFIGWFMLQMTGFEFPELGFMICPTKWNQGYATEVSSELIRYGLKDLGFAKILAATLQENTASQAVLKKVGMQPTSGFRAPDRDPSLIYYIVS